MAKYLHCQEKSHEKSGKNIRQDAYKPCNNKVVKNLFLHEVYLPLTKTVLNQNKNLA